MIKTYSDFLAVVSGKCSLYAQIPSEHLNFQGEQTYALYRSVQFTACFADSASELLNLMPSDKDMEDNATYAGTEYRQIMRCLERLAAAENVPATGKEDTQ